MKYEAAVMHDFFVDRIVECGDISKFLSTVRKKAMEGGGGIHGIKQLDVRGGNAVNLARALCALGAKTLLITHTDRDHEPILRGAFEGSDAELVVKQKPAGLTVALEGGVNVMLGDPRGAGTFGPDDLDRSDWQKLQASRLICVVNWAANKLGTQLLLALRKRLPSRTLYLGTADVRDRFREYKQLISIARKRRLIDWVGLNEQEAYATARSLDMRQTGMENICMLISEELGATVDIHTESSSYTCRNGEVTVATTRRVRPRRLTGAGDVWEAASLFAGIRGFDDESRLNFANAAARLYVSSRGLVTPCLEDVMAALD